METQKYCDLQLLNELESVGMNIYEDFKTLTDIIRNITLHDAQMWLMTKGIYVYPQIHKYVDDEFEYEPSWECIIYADMTKITTVGRRLTYYETLYVGLREGIKLLKKYKN